MSPGCIRAGSDQQALADSELLKSRFPLMLAGPIRAIGQFSRRGELFAGEILWAWVGVVWISLPDPADLFKVVRFALLSITLAIGVAVFGLQPGGRDGAWAHYVGWALLAMTTSLYGILVMCSQG